jgi:hypothetical protein
MTGKSSTAGNFGSRLQEEVQRTVVCGTTTVKYYHYNCNIFLEWRNCVVGLFDIEFSNTILLLINLVFKASFLPLRNVDFGSVAVLRSAN